MRPVDSVAGDIPIGTASQVQSQFQSRFSLDNDFELVSICVNVVSLNDPFKTTITILYLQQVNCEHFEKFYQQLFLYSRQMAKNATFTKTLQ